jgi:hypothetical protein
VILKESSVKVSDPALREKAARLFLPESFYDRLKPDLSAEIVLIDDVADCGGDRESFGVDFAVSRSADGPAGTPVVPPERRPDESLPAPKGDGKLHDQMYWCQGSSSVAFFVGSLRRIGC